MSSSQALAVSEKTPMSTESSAVHSCSDHAAWTRKMSSEPSIKNGIENRLSAPSGLSVSGIAVVDVKN